MHMHLELDHETVPFLDIYASKMTMSQLQDSSQATTDPIRLGQEIESFPTVPLRFGMANSNQEFKRALKTHFLRAAQTNI